MAYRRLLLLLLLSPLLLLLLDGSRKGHRNISHVPSMVQVIQHLFRDKFLSSRLVVDRKIATITWSVRWKRLLARFLVYESPLQFIDSVSGVDKGENLQVA